MKKKDLKSGMIVEIRNGNKYLVLTNSNFYMDIVFIRDGGFLRGDSFDNNLDQSEPINQDYDIMKIYGNTLDCTTYFRINLSLVISDKPIWERKEKKEMTIAEIEKKLGYLISIVK